MPPCPHCGHHSEETRYCPRCGTKLKKFGWKGLSYALAFLVACAAFLGISYKSSQDQPPPPAPAVASVPPSSFAPTQAPRPAESAWPQRGERPAPTRAPGPPPARPVETAADEPAEEEVEEVTVYVTRTGKKYHRGSCHHLRQSKIPMALSEARRLYDPCKVCNPPR